MSERTYTLADFAHEVDTEHPLTERRIPVLSNAWPSFKYHAAIVIGGDHGGPGLEPTCREVDQLCAYLEKHMRYYNDTHRRRVAARGPFDVDGTVNTHIFRKHAEHGWQYHAMSWDNSGPVYFPTRPWHPLGPLSLEALLDHIYTFGGGAPTQDWLDLKAESGAFAEVSA